MVTLRVNSRETIDELHALAIKLGGTDEGAPGPRGPGTFYAAYFRDLDGNKLNFFTDQPRPSALVEVLHLIISHQHIDFCGGLVRFLLIADDLAVRRKIRAFNLRGVIPQL